MRKGRHGLCLILNIKTNIMKKQYYIIILVLLFALQQQSISQVWMGVYALRSNSNAIKNPDIGYGGGMSLMSKGKALEKDGKGLRLQLGGDFNYSGLGHRNFSHVPLSAPQVGDARVTLSNGLLSMNMLFQLSLPNKSIFIPYGNAFLGYRGTFSSLSITPYQRNPGYESETDKSLSSAHGLNYGIGAGILTKLRKNLYLDIGATYSEMAGGGRIADLSSAYSTGQGINLNFKSAPNSMTQIKLGLVWYIELDDDDHHDKKNEKDDCNCKCERRDRVRVGSGWGLGGGWNFGKSNGININGGGIKIK